MKKPEKTLRQVVEAQSDANVNFRDLCHMLRWLGFEEEIQGSHHTFGKGGILRQVVLQPEGKQAKKYQVRQVRQMILENKLHVREQ